MKKHLYQFYKLVSVIDKKTGNESQKNMYKVLKDLCYHSGFRIMYLPKGEKLIWTTFTENIYYDTYIKYITSITDIKNGFIAETEEIIFTFEESKISSKEEYFRIRNYS